MVRYVDRVLQPGEAVSIACRLHWIVFARALSLVTVAVVLAIFSAFWPADALPHQGLLYAALLCLALAPFYAVGAWVLWASTEIAVTDRRVIYKHGLISRRTIEMNSSKIETVDVVQGPLARLLNYGDVIIRGTGGTFEPLRMVGAPLALRNAILAG